MNQQHKNPRSPLKAIPYLVSSVRAARRGRRAARNSIVDPAMTYLRSWAFMLKYPRSGRNIFICCMPKSGSTYTQRVMELGLPNCFRFYRQPDIYYNLTGKGLFRLRLRCSIQRAHMHATEWNIGLLRAHGINKYVLLLRDPRDVVVSFFHQVEKEGFSARFVHLTQDYFRLDHQEKITYLIRLLLPRLVDFVNSWDSPKQEVGELDVLTLYYRDMVEAPHEHFRRILEFYKLPERVFDTKAIELREKVRYRRGETGQWKQYFTTEQKRLANVICGDVLSRHGWESACSAGRHHEEVLPSL